MKDEDFTKEGNDIIFSHFANGNLYFTTGRANFLNESWETYLFPIPSSEIARISGHEKAFKFKKFIKKAIKEGTFVKNDNYS